MRVRLIQRTDTPTRRKRGVVHRRGAAPAPFQSAPPPPAAPVTDLIDERRVREAGGPHDRAQYACTCGYVFDADVSTSVACPHCGTGQAW
jgi:hypothetical protein